MHWGLSVWTRISKTIAPIDLIRGWVDDPDLDSIIDSRIIHHWEIGHMPSKYTMTSNVRCDENMRYYITCAS